MSDARRGSEEYGTFAEVSYCSCRILQQELRLWKEAGCTRGSELLTSGQRRCMGETPGGKCSLDKSYWDPVSNEVRRGTKDTAEYSVQYIFFVEMMICRDQLCRYLRTSSFQ